MSEELPKGWARTGLAVIADVNMGQSPPSSTYNTEGQGLPFFQGKAEFGQTYPTVVKYCSSPVKTAVADDVLISVRAPVGPTNLCPTEACIGRGLASIRPKGEIPVRYLLYLLRSIEQWISSQGTGSTFTAIGKSDLQVIDVPLAPLAEQRRIVEKLEKLLERVNACRERLDRIPAILKRFRQSVLSAACSGRLTEGWRKGHQFGRWQNVSLADVIKEKPKNGYSARPVKHETPWRVLTLTATTSGRFDARHFKYFDETIPAGSALWLQPGDILVQRGNTIEYVGVSAVYDGPSDAFVYPDLMMRLRANERITTAFLYCALSWEKTRNYLRSNATGTAGSMPKINQGVLINAPLPLPPVPEQREIVRRVDELFTLADQLETRYAKAKAQVEKLTQAILAKAFRGELVPQDPNDEPAEKLLERIRAARTPTGSHSEARGETPGKPEKPKSPDPEGVQQKKRARSRKTAP